MRAVAAIAFVAAAFAVPAGRAGAIDLGVGEGVGGLLGEGIDFKGGMLDWEEDEAGRRVAILRNYAVIILPNLTISARNMALNVELQEVYAEGDVVFEETAGNSFMCDQLTFNYQEWKGLAKNIRLRVKMSDAETSVRDFLDDEPSLDLSRGRSLSLNDPTSGPIRRMYVSADELRAHDQDTFELINAKITPDAFAKPHWYFGTPAALLRRDEKIEAYHNTVRIGNLPVLYFPYLIRDLQYDWPWMRAEAGYNSDFGVYARTQWALRLRENPNALLQMEKLIFDVDWFSRRGAGLGVETTYKVGGWEDSLGKLKVYGVYEYGISKSRDWNRAFDDNDDKIYFDQDPTNFKPSLYRKDFRWAVDWEHAQRFNELWDVRAAVHLYHDRDYLKEYDATNYWNEIDRRNMFSLRRLDKDWSLELASEARLSNKWMSGPQYYPELRATVPGMQIGNLPLFLKDDLRIGLVDYAFDEDEVKYMRGRNDGLWALDPETELSAGRLWKGDNYGSFFRAFNELRLEAPLKVFDAVTVKPWVGLRTAYYGDTLGRPEGPSGISINGDEIRGNAASTVFTRERTRMRGTGGSDTYHAVPFGLDVTSRFYTIFGASDQWRFISEPAFSYLENTTPSHDSWRELYIIDEHDVYFRQRKLGLSFHGSLQRRNYGDAPDVKVPYRNVLDFNLAFNYYPRREDGNRFNGDDKRASDIEFDVNWHPRDRFSLQMGLLYDPDDGVLKRGIFRAGWQISDLMRFTATHYHYSDDYWYTGGFLPHSAAQEWIPTNNNEFVWGRKNLNPSDQTVLAMRTKLWNDSSHYSLEAAVGYEWEDSSAGWERSREGVRHGLNKYRVTLYRDVDTFEMALSYVRDRYRNDHGLYFSFAPKSFMGFDRPPPAYTGAVEELSEGRYSDAEYYYGRDYRIDAPVADADLKDVQF